ncbi:MAG: hypothetical protein CG437_96, partial [Methanosaeta sp. NSP1]
MRFMLSEKQFLFSFCLRILYPGRYWLDALSFQAIFEFVIPPFFGRRISFHDLLL